jgi:thioredoxin reductase
MSYRVYTDNKIDDMLTIGGGPAGPRAGLNAARAHSDAALFEWRVSAPDGGNTATEEALYLTKFAGRVHVVHRRERLRATPTREKAFQNQKISFILSNVIDEKGWTEGVAGVDARDMRSSKVSILSISRS